MESQIQMEHHMIPELMNIASQFGTAGLMGVLWVWERRHSRKRENQLDETHTRLMEHRESLRLMIDIVRQNTQTIERYGQTQEHLIHLLERIGHDLQKTAA